MADGEWYLDGTQSPPPLPFESDPLAGLVTGEMFADPVAAPEVFATDAEPGTTTTSTAPRRLYARSGRTTERPQARPLRPATAPDAIPVAAPLSARSGVQPNRPPAAPAAQIGSTPRRIAPAAPARVAPVNWQANRPVPRTPPARRGAQGRPAASPYRAPARRAGAGCSIFLVIIVIVVIAFIVLGIVLGHGSGGIGGSGVGG